MKIIDIAAFLFFKIEFNELLYAAILTLTPISL